MRLTIQSSKAYVGERRVGEKREAFEQVLVVIVLDHRRPVGLKQKTARRRQTQHGIIVLFSKPAKKAKETESYQEVGGRRHGDPVVEQFSCVVVHRTASFHGLKETRTLFSSTCVYIAPLTPESSCERYKPRVETHF